MYMELTGMDPFLMTQLLTNDIVEVPSVLNPLSDEHYGELCSEIYPLATSSDYGIDLYQTCLSFVYDKLSLHQELQRFGKHVAIGYGT